MIDEIEEFKPSIEIKSIDELRNTRITVSCYRETKRLDRMLRVFQKALTLARADGNDADFSASLDDLHDHKGTLTATWVGMPKPEFLGYVDQAWQDENECILRHVWQGRGVNANTFKKRVP